MGKVGLTKRYMFPKVGDVTPGNNPVLQVMLHHPHRGTTLDVYGTYKNMPFGTLTYNCASNLKNFSTVINLTFGQENVNIELRYISPTEFRVTYLNTGRYVTNIFPTMGANIDDNGVGGGTF